MILNTETVSIQLPTSLLNMQMNPTNKKVNPNLKEAIRVKQKLASSHLLLYLLFTSRASLTFLVNSEVVSVVITVILSHHQHNLNNLSL